MKERKTFGGSLTNVPDPSAVSITTLINSVSQSRWYSVVDTLSKYNRYYSFNDYLDVLVLIVIRYTKGTGIKSAQDWITSQLVVCIILVLWFSF